MRLTVDSVLSGPDETLKDIRPPADLSPPSWRQPGVLAVAALAIVAVMVSGSLLVRRRLQGRGEQVVSSVDTRTPWQAAVQEFDRIDRLDLPGDGRFKEHYTLIARVIQGYVRATYIEDVGRPDATDMTTEEITSAIRQSSLDRKNAGVVVDLLLEAELVRFSSYAPSASRGVRGVARRPGDCGGDEAGGRRCGATGECPFPSGGNGVTDLTFQSPWLLFLLPAAVAPAILPYLWKQRMGPVTMSYPGNRASSPTPEGRCAFG